MKRAAYLIAATLLATTPLTFTAPAAAQMRALSDPVVPHPDPESLFTSRDRTLNRTSRPRSTSSATC